MSAIAIPIVYRKTQKGSAEVRTRAHGLALRARSVLILVDGKRDDDSLRGLTGTGDGSTLALLLEQGYIEVSGSPASPPAAAPATQATSARRQAGEGGRGNDLAARCRAAVREVNETLGPTGESLAIRMERSHDLAELAQAVQMAVQVITVARGRAVAEGFAKRHVF